MELTELDEKNIHRLLMKMKELEKENADFKEQNNWLTEKLSTRKTEKDGWKPTSEYEAKLYRGWKLDRERNHGMVVILNKDDTPAPDPLGNGRYTQWTSAQNAIDDYMKKFDQE